MRILLISYFFPPYNAIGAVRLGKTAKYLTRMGHDVRVITAADQPLQPTLPVEIPAERVVYTRWVNANRPAELLLGGRQKVTARGYVPPSSSGLMRWGFGVARSVYKGVLVPDEQIGWYPFAVRAALELAGGWRPDVVYASAMPLTSLLVAHRVAARLGVPWIAELRDLWTDNHYVRHHPWRRALEQRMERRVLGSAAGLVTMSEPWAQLLRDRYGKPAAAVSNGFDPADFPAPAPPQDDTLRIVYTGMIYRGKRDPMPLFAALRLLGDEAAGVRVRFYGRYLDMIHEMAAEQGVEALVETHDQLPYSDALRSQAEADLLLLLMWDDPRERGLFPGKVFEYIGARRPILGIGPTEGVVAEMLRERGLGVMVNDPQSIAARLREWIAAKRRDGAIAPLPRELAAGLTREEQTRRLAGFIESVAGAGA